MKRYAFAFIILACNLYCYAKSVSKEMATEVAINYWNIVYTKKYDSSQAKVKIISPQNKLPLYIIQLEDGWVLVSSEDTASPILASSPVGKFPLYEDMPKGMQWLISYYESANQFTRDSITIEKQSIHREWQQLLTGEYSLETSGSRIPSSCTLEYMKFIKWGQSKNNSLSCEKSYNKYCPVSTDAESCSRYPVGCAAVALGMVMWYWQWPWCAIIPRKHNASAYINDPYLCLYDWNSMPPQLYSHTLNYEADLVAYFLRDCGYAISMNYTPLGSGSTLFDVQTALETIFHYKTTKIQYKDDFSSNNWCNMLKEELSSGRPIIYRGQNNTMGHAFVLFGYTADNKFRINWGANGWGLEASYSLDVLNMDGVYFNQMQMALTGIEPNYPQCINTNVLSQTNVNTNLFEIHKGGAIVTETTNGGVHIYNSQKGCIYGSNDVILYPPFTIEKGAQVHIALRDANCLSETSNIIDSVVSDQIESLDFQEKIIEKDMQLLPVETDYPVHIIPEEIIEHIYVYNLSGILVMQTNQLGDVLSLPTDVYIIYVLTKNGQMLRVNFKQ